MRARRVRLESENLVAQGSTGGHQHHSWAFQRIRRAATRGLGRTDLLNIDFPITGDLPGVGGVRDGC
ncbi:hypothetical protein Ga0074812_104142 [Parafrankia irregularis]|uniref:Uncharacterized protein n=2 Tax=Frankiaceae TaxID=74712 RepID=A0A0S4QHP0_9ACTN|nr:hypothetical protein Ga0074812_104142 [Parafrankia irregularis]